MPIRLFFLMLFREKAYVALIISGVSIGMTAIIASNIAVNSAVASVERQQTVVDERLGYLLEKNGDFFSDRYFAELYLTPGIEAFPMIKHTLTLFGNEAVLLGIDPFSLMGRPVAAGFQPSPGRPLIGANTLALPPDSPFWAVVDQGHLSLTFSGTKRRFEITEMDPLPGFEGVNLIVADIATAQDILGKPGEMNRVEVIFHNDIPPRLASLPDRFREAGFKLISVGKDDSGNAELTKPYRINLGVLSLLTLFVGMLIVYNTQNFLYASRCRYYGILKQLGLRRVDIFVALYSEALLLGLIGSLISIPCGVIVGELIAGNVRDTFSEVYRLPVGDFRLLTYQGIFIGITVGMIVMVAVSTLFAFRVSRISPARLFAEDVNSGSGAFTLWAMVAGVPAGAVGLLMALSPVTNLVLTIVGIFLILLFWLLCLPPMIRLLLAVFTGLAARRISAPIGFAMRFIRYRFSKVAVMFITFVLSTATVFSVSVMIQSFESSFTVWLSKILSDEYYITGSDQNQPFVLPPAALQSVLEANPQRYRTVSRLEADTNQGQIPLVVYTTVGTDITAYLSVLSGFTAEQAKAYETGKGILVSEVLKNRRDIRPGQTLEILTDTGQEVFKVVGVFRDYSAQQGMIVMSGDVFRKYWDLRELTSFTFSLAGKQIDTASFGKDFPGLLLRNRSAVRQQSLDIFRRSFAITRIINLITLLVAFIGCLSAMLILHAELDKQKPVLTLLGAGPGYLFRVKTCANIVLGFFAGLLSYIPGAVLAVLITGAVNVKSFGWTMALSFSPNDFLFGPAVGVTAALTALLPVIFGMRRNTAGQASH